MITYFILKNLLHTHSHTHIIFKRLCLDPIRRPLFKKKKDRKREREKEKSALYKNICELLKIYMFKVKKIFNICITLK